MSTSNNNEVSKSWFCVLNNPEKHGYSGTPQEICEQLCNEWVGTSSTRTGAWAYCVSAAGLPHVHMVLEDTVAMRFSQVKKTYAVGMHIEPTKGTKQQAEDYINKRHPYEEKGEQVVCIVRHGEIKGRSGNRSDLDEIQNLINAGKTPNEIMQLNFAYRRYERMIRDAFFAKRFAETPPIRPVKVHWICGEAGSGKTFHYVKLCQSAGEQNVYLVSDLRHGSFDKYSAEPILFLDELKPDSTSYRNLLVLLDQYKRQVSARYTNVYALWTDVYITSIYAPETLYAAMVPPCWQNADDYSQLRRRITDITYCYIDISDGSHQSYTLPMAQYATYADLQQQAFMPRFPFEDSDDGVGR